MHKEKLLEPIYAMLAQKEVWRVRFIGPFNGGELWLVEVF